MLVLLVIFMVTAPLITQSVVDLPSIGDIAQKQQFDSIEISVTKTGGFTIRDPNLDDTRSVGSAEDVVELIRERRALFPDVPIVISADKELRYQEVIALLGKLLEEGIDAVGLGVQTQQ